ncbi:MAG TPA: hypothetical protein VHL52_00910 [Acidimicrobiia bacterium]|nr:hypothetical protein [Acidimicrobiia bacterium]
MADFETKLRWLSERGDPVGAEELIERIEADLAGVPLVVVAKRREGRAMTKTQQPPTATPRKRYRGPALAVAIFVAVLVLPALYLAFSGESDPVADTQPTPTTVAPEAEIMTDLEVIEAGVAAVYSGDADRAVELFDLSDRDDEAIRQEAAYQAAIGGQLTLNCRELDTPGVFSCRTPYHNAMTDAIHHRDSGDTNRVVVEDGVIRAFGFPEHTFIALQMGTFLAMEGRYEGYENCVFGPFPEFCATIQMESLDSWIEWRQSLEPAALVEFAVESWYEGDCMSARHVSDFAASDCQLSADTPNQTMEYESILGAEVSVDGCEEATGGSLEQSRLTCEVHYSNAMSIAVGKPPSVTVREFTVYTNTGVIHLPDDRGPWYTFEYPEDTELRESFRLFAEAGAVQDEFAEAGCANLRTPECADLIMDNLDDWAAWYETNS